MAKNIETGETTPPLPHDEYTREANRLRQKEDADKERAKHPAPAKPSPAVGQQATPPVTQPTQTAKK
jgi:hypothetical protein